MEGGDLFDPDLHLRFLVVRHVHALKGTCFGRVVRSFFLHSGETTPQIDCFLPRTEAAETLLAVLAVEHTVRLSEKQVFGTNVYRVTRATVHGLQCGVDLHIVAYHQGLTRRGRLPRNVPSPMFDIDHVYWDREGVVSAMPAALCRAEEARSHRLGLSHLLDRCMRRQFATVNTLPRRVPDALLLLLERAKELVLAGFVMDDTCDSRLPVVQRCADPTLQCPVRQRAAHGLVVKLPCLHVVSHEGATCLVEQAKQGDWCVRCPVCERVVCAKNQAAQGIV